MGSVRFILLLSIGLVLTMIWQAWQQDYGTPKSSPNRLEEAAKGLPDDDVPNLETSELISDAPTLLSNGPTTNNQQTWIHVETDVYDIMIDPKGGSLRSLSLKKYPKNKKNPDDFITLLADNSHLFFIAQGGLSSASVSPDHNAIYDSKKNHYILGPNQEVLRIPLVWEKAGLTVTKTFQFRKDDYHINIDYLVENQTGDKWSGRAYDQLQRSEPIDKGNYFIYTYTGAVISSPEERYEKITFSDIQSEPLKDNITNGWAAMLQHYFLAAIIPTSKTVPEYYFTRAIKDERFIIGSSGPQVTLANQQSHRFERSLYIGPKDQKRLKETAEGLELTVDYGFLWFIGKPLFWCLDLLYSYTQNWGWSIILLTIFLKLLFFPLSARGYRSMGHMRRLQPRLLALRERYKDNRTQLNQAMMEFYKKEKLNPMGGCFPILIQIPVFIALYWVLLESVEMRQASFILWLNDLSSPDPYYVLPLVMGLTMFIQQKLNPAPMDPMQAKILAMLPVMFAIFFAFFPSGLVLYWVINNILSIAQQWVITRQIESAAQKH